MRDIREDLLDRLRTLGDDRRRLLTALKALDVQEAAVKALLEGEDKRFGGDSLPLGESGGPQNTVTAPTSLFRRFVAECLSDGREWSLSRMSKVAIERGLISAADGRSIGRSLHAALLGLKQQGLVEIPEPGHWKLVRPHLVKDDNKGAA